MKKRVLGIYLSMALIAGSMSMSVMAASTTARLNSSKNRVSTTYTDCKGYTVVYVHDSDSGYQFQPNYNSVRLKSQVVVTGTVVADVIVSY